MRNGFRVYDSDTHVNPAAEVLEKYVDPGFRKRLDCQPKACFSWQFKIHPSHDQGSSI